MKYQPIYLICFLFTLFACEDVVDIDVPTSEPKLVIDASINWIKGTTGNQQEIILTLTAPYFDDVIPPANNAQIYITDQNMNVFTFIENGNTGIYQNTTFLPVINSEYELTIIYDNETYIGTETLFAVPDFDYIEQDLDGGIIGDETEIKAFFTDSENEENFYFFEFIPSIPILKTLDTFSDEFSNGNELFGYYTEEDLDVGDSVIIKNHGVSEQFHNFMSLLLEQTEGGGAFATQPASVRGNCINTTHPDNYPLGYFRLSEVAEVNYTITP